MKRSGFFSILLGLAALGGLVFSGCSKQPPVDKTKDQTGLNPAKDDSIKQACDLLQSATEVTHFRDFLEILKTPLAEQGAGDIPGEYQTFLRDKAHLNEDELEEVASLSFRPIDANHVEACFFFRDAAKSLTVEGMAPLDQARRVFGWSMRRVLLHEQADEWLPSEQVLRRGFGGVRDRAMVFLEALRQLRIEGCIVAPAGPPAEPYSPLLVGVMVPRADKEEGGEIALFDPRLGIAVPGPKGEGIATLRQALADPDLLKDAGLDAKQVGELSVYVACPLSALAPRMKFVQDIDCIAESARTVLYTNLGELQAKATKAAGKEALVWNAPATNKKAPPPSPLRTLRLFLSPEDGGLDTTGRQKNYMLHLVPLTPVFLDYYHWKILPNLPAQATPMFNRFNEDLFIKFHYEPEEKFLRGQYQLAIDRIARINSALEAEEHAERMDDAEFQKQVAEWRDRVKQAYAGAGGKVTAIWAEDQYILNLLQVGGDIADLSKFPKKMLSKILFTACKEPLGQQVRYLVASCWQERAHTHAARAEHLTAVGKNAQVEKEEARSAWSNARKGWGDYLEHHGLRPATLKERITAINDVREKNDFDALVLLWEFLHSDMHAWFEARLNLAEAQQNLGNNAAAKKTLETLRADIAAIRDNAQRKTVFAYDLERANAVSGARLGRRLQLLDLDWSPRGPIAALEATINRRMPK